jgi:hypothetical protein
MDVELLKLVRNACKGLDEADFRAVFEKVDEIKGRHAFSALSVLSEPATRTSPISKNL